MSCDILVLSCDIPVGVARSGSVTVRACTHILTASITSGQSLLAADARQDKAFPHTLHSGGRDVV